MITEDKVESKFNIGDSIRFDRTKKFEDSDDIIEGEIADKQWDSDRQEWLYHILTTKHGESYHILFVRERCIREGEDFYEYHKRKGESQ